MFLFDWDMQYGPKGGISRLDRYSRAESLGLKPPVELRDIITLFEEETKRREL